MDSKTSKMAFGNAYFQLTNTSFAIWISFLGDDVCVCLGGGGRGRRRGKLGQELSCDWSMQLLGITSP